MSLAFIAEYDTQKFFEKIMEVPEKVILFLK